MTTESDIKWLLESNAELRDRVLGLEGRTTDLEQDYHGIITYFFADADPRRSQNVPEKLKKMEDALEVLGPWLREVVDGYRKKIEALEAETEFLKTCIDLLVRHEYHPHLAERFYEEARKRTCTTDSSTNASTT